MVLSGKFLQTASYFEDPGLKKSSSQTNRSRPHHPLLRLLPRHKRMYDFPPLLSSYPPKSLTSPKKALKNATTNSSTTTPPAPASKNSSKNPTRTLPVSLARSENPSLRVPPTNRSTTSCAPSCRSSSTCGCLTSTLALRP